MKTKSTTKASEPTPTEDKIAVRRAPRMWARVIPHLIQLTESKRLATELDALICVCITDDVTLEEVLLALRALQE